LIVPKELLKKFTRKENFLLIDLRESFELEISSIKGAMHIPFGLLSQRMKEMDRKQEIILFCRTGIRSRKALELLVGSGFSKVKHLQGGINSWASTIDPDLPVY